MNSIILDDLFKVIQSRKGASPDESYTSRLFSKGENKILKKIGEEATELVMAGAKDRRDEIICESADLLYHMMVLLAYKDMELEEVYRELARRQGISGLEEKAQRKEK
jgi:phosphoribosyl-ATP pyrophosphohydrolase